MMTNETTNQDFYKGKNSKKIRKNNF